MTEVQNLFQLLISQILYFHYFLLYLNLPIDKEQILYYNKCYGKP